MKKKIMIITFSLLTLCIYLGRVIYVNLNNEYFYVDTETHECNETFIYNDFQYNMHWFGIFSKSDFEKKFNVETSDDDTVKYIVAEIVVEYIGDEDDIASGLRYAKFESGSWRNGQSNNLFTTINKDGTKFNKNGKKVLYAVSCLKPIQFSEPEWNRIDKRSFKLVFATYPKKVEVKCL